ncbi:sulfatase-like hydrolase/transferase [Candidatus Latescibacterota bacterium]
MPSIDRRDFLKAVSSASLPFVYSSLSCGSNNDSRPNFLLLMSDNHSWNHLGCYGDPVVKTPNIDRLARQGVRFTQAYCAAPSCSAARAGILTGQDIWRLEEGANLWSILPDKFTVFTDILEQSGYFVGSQGKGWGPGSVKDSGRDKNHAGWKYKDFEAFLEANTPDKPWCYWFSSPDPHRPYAVGSGVESGMDINNVVVPPYLPDTEAVRNDMCDYYYEVEKFDTDVGRIIQELEDSEQLENTIIIICSDNGWQMPRGLANLYDFGTRVPLIFFWKDHIPGGRVVDDFVNLNDLAPTFLEMAEQNIPEDMTAHSMTNLLFSKKSGRIDGDRNHIITARERHAFCRKHGQGYPGRAIRTDEYLYIRNFEPDRWPAGDPPLFGDVDAHMMHYPCPTKMHMLLHRNDPKVKPLFEDGFMKRPEEELFDLGNDPYQMNNVACNDGYKSTKSELSQKLDDYLRDTGDPRALGKEIIWDSTPYYCEVDFTPRPNNKAIEALDLAEEYTYLKK